jgi:hypothetical protein
VSYEAAAGFNQPFEIRLLDNNSVNINKAPGSAIIHTNGEWKQGAANVDDVVIAPQQGILLRNKLPASSGS